IIRPSPSSTPSGWRTEVGSSANNSSGPFEITFTNRLQIDVDILSASLLLAPEGRKNSILEESRRPQKWCSDEGDHRLARGITTLFIFRENRHAGGLDSNPNTRRRSPGRDVSASASERRDPNSARCGVPDSRHRRQFLQFHAIRLSRRALSS